MSPIDSSTAILNRYDILDADGNVMAGLAPAPKPHFSRIAALAQEATDAA